MSGHASVIQEDYVLLFVSTTTSWGYVWTCISDDAVFYHADKSRAATVLDLYFPYWDIPVTVDGYAAYNRFKTIQRCLVPHTARCRV